ncbi:MAG: phage tail tape measure protein [Planctomycetota bacterium]|jgi:TP901 family phage tail tape measure protein
MALPEVGLEAVIEGLDKFNKGAKDIVDAFDRIDKGADEVGKSTKGLSVKTVALGTTLGNVATGGLALVGSALTKASGALVGFGVGAIEAAISYESAFAGVLKTTEGLTDEMGNLTDLGKELRQGFIDLSQEIPVSPEALAGIGELGGQLGIGTESILEFTQTMADLGVATNLTSEEAASAFAQLANVLGTSQDDFDRLGSATVALGNNFATTERDIVAFASRIGGAGAIAGLTEGDVLAIGAAMSSVGVQAEAGGTAIQKVLLNINTAVLTSSDELSTFAETAGLSAEEFADLWEKDASAAFQMFVEGLGAQGDNAILTLDELGLKDQQLVRAFLSLSKAGGLLGEAIDAGNQAFEENNALANEAAQRYATTESQIQLMKNTTDALKRSLGTALLPTFNMLLESFKTFVSDNGPAITAAFERIGAFLAENLPIAIQAAADFWRDTLQPAFENTGTFIQDTVIPAFNRIVAFLRENLPPALEAAKTIWEDTLQPAFENIILVIQEDLLPVFDNLKAWWETNGPAIQGVVGDIFSALEANFNVIANDVIPFLVEQFGKIGEWWETNGPLMTPLIEGIGDAFGLLATIFEETWNVIEPLLGTLLDTILGLATAVLQAANGDWAAAWETIKTTVIDDTIPGIETSVTTFLDTIARAMGGSLEEIKTTWSGNWDLVKQAVTTIWEEIKTTVDIAIQNIVDFITTDRDWFQIGFNIMTLLINGIKSIIETVLTVFETAVQAWNTVLFETDWLQVGADLIEKVVEGITSVIDDVITAMSDLATDSADAVIEFDWIGVGADIIDGLISGIENSANAFFNAIKNLAAGALAAMKAELGIGSPSKEFIDLGIDIIEGLIVGIESQKLNFFDAMGELFDFGGRLGRIASGFSRRFKSMAIDPLLERGADPKDLSIFTIARELQKLKGVPEDFLSVLSPIFQTDDAEQIRRSLRFLAAEAAAGRIGFLEGNEEGVALLQEAAILAGTLTDETLKFQVAQEKLLRIERQRQDIQFLQQQLDLLQLVAENQLDVSILAGLELGLDADLEKLLAAMSVAMTALVDQANAELQAASPSKVFARIGGNITAGLAGGIASTFGQVSGALAGSLQSLVATPALVSGPIGPSGAMSSTTQNFNLGGNTINTGMDQATFEARVIQAIRNNL